MPETGAAAGPDRGDGVGQAPSLGRVEQHLFVYYRVDEADLSAVLSAARTFLAGLGHEHPMLHTALLRRPGAASGQITLMETCRFAGTLPDDVRAEFARGPAALQAWLRSDRHVEEFVPCA